MSWNLRAIVASGIGVLVGLLMPLLALADAGTLGKARQRGYITCGASQGTTGFGLPDENGVWHGLDVDTCRAVAVAVFGDKNKARFIPLSGQQRLTALQIISGVR